MNPLCQAPGSSQKEGLSHLDISSEGDSRGAGCFAGIDQVSRPLLQETKKCRVIFSV